MEKEANEKKQLEEKLTTACEVIENRLSTIWGAIDSVDNKINIALGFGSTILGLLAGFYALGNKEWTLASLILFSLALVAYIILASLSIYAYRVKAWSYRPDVDTLLKYCVDIKYSAVNIKKWIAEECNISCYDNIGGLNKKATIANRILVVILETILLTVGLVCSLI
jgi:hypothetical protein